jgi:hypothetical protein
MSQAGDLRLGEIAYELAPAAEVDRAAAPCYAGFLLSTFR